MKCFKSVLHAFAVVFLFASATFAQESQTRVIDEVVAQVNDGVITLSRIKRESKGIVDSYVQEGKKRDEAQKMVDEKQGELIANLINEELLVQKSKEMGLEADVEAQLNQRFLQIMKQNNMKTLDELHKEMEKSGIDPEEMRGVWRKQATRELVLQREVQAKLYWKPNGKELKEYYEKHKAKFTKPETINISEIFLGFAGRDENAVRDKAKQIVTQLRGGADFAKVAAENSDRPDAATTGGKVQGALKVSELDAKYAEALKNLKVGGVTDPIEVDQIGINILRVDERSQASSESVFDESAVRLALMQEGIAAEQQKFMAKLREESYIKISDSYRPLVGPLLFMEERKATTEVKSDKKADNK